MSQLKRKIVALVFFAMMLLLTVSISAVRASVPDARLLAVTPTPTRIDAFTFCAFEGGTCTVNGTVSVRFGINDHYTFKTVTGSIPCTSAAFGVIMNKVPEECRYKAMPVTSYAGWTACATEHAVCTVSGGNSLVRYGTGTSYVYKTTATTINCVAQAFGSDPAPGEAKQCLFIAVPPSDPTAAGSPWTQCAVEGGTCFTSGSAKTIAYGFAPETAFLYKYISSSSTPCTNTAFGGDPYPFPGTKVCYKAPADADNFGWVRCASENGTCTFLGTKTVAFGAGTSFTYKNATGRIVCTSAVFGDPLPGTPKVCYYNITFGE